MPCDEKYVRNLQEKVHQLRNAYHRSLDAEKTLESQLQTIRTKAATQRLCLEEALRQLVHARDAHFEQYRDTYELADLLRSSGFSDEGFRPGELHGSFGSGSWEVPPPQSQPPPWRR